MHVGTALKLCLLLMSPQKVAETSADSAHLVQWDFVVLKYSQPDFLVPLFKNVSDSFAKSFTFV